ncbi:MAG TPA: 50S ribosomal protein L9 [Candidatus Acidoferrales bacterium]|nr:50S ribosomal protein L9 [Candidatus Acidoferrales bacterium]
MEVILREEVPNLGSTGDVVKVKPGFARNYLLPRGLAVVADRRNIHVLDHEKRLAAEKRDRDLRAAEGLAQKLTSTRVAIAARAGEEGKLFGSVTNQDIERALAGLGFVIDRRRIRLDEPIKQVGEHSVAVQLRAGVVAHVTVSVEAES